MFRPIIIANIYISHQYPKLIKLEKTPNFYQYKQLLLFLLGLGRTPLVAFITAFYENFNRIHAKLESIRKGYKLIALGKVVGFLN